MTAVAPRHVRGNTQVLSCVILLVWSYAIMTTSHQLNDGPKKSFRHELNMPISLTANSLLSESHLRSFFTLSINATYPYNIFFERTMPASYIPVLITMTAQLLPLIIIFFISLHQLWLNRAQKAPPENPSQRNRWWRLMHSMIPSSRPARTVPVGSYWRRRAPQLNPPSSIVAII